MKKLYIPGTNIALISDMYGKGSKHSNPLWVSDLTCRHIGSAGVVEMETIRFFSKFENPILETEKAYKHIFHWHL